MKTPFNFLLPALCLALAGPAKAQNNFGENLYPTLPAIGQTYETSSAVLTQIHSARGHVWSSFQTSPNTGNYNYQVHVTDPTGSYTNFGPTPSIGLFNGYNLSRDFSCNTGLALMPFTYGVTVIEAGLAVSPLDINYAMTGAFGDANGAACLFHVMNIDALPIHNPQLYDFPTGATNITKPYVVQLPGANVYFICGSYFDPIPSKQIMYVMRVNGVSGVQAWSFNYTSGERLEPRGMLVSPYNANELIIVGRNDTDPATGRREDGFFMKLNAVAGAGGGNVLGFKVIGSTAVAHNSEFNSVAPAFDASPGPSGYVIGGLSDLVSGFGPSWMLKVDQNGDPGSGNWNTLITGTSANQAITGVLERLNTAPAYEYYGVTTSGVSQMTVFKLDNNGDFPAVNNEFEYAGGAGPGFINDISAGAASFQGIQVTGTGPADEIYNVKAYYNGETMCAPNIFMLTTASQGAGPGNVLTPTPLVNKTPGFLPNTCFQLDADFTSGDDGIVTFCGGAGSIPPGDNSRMMAAGMDKRALKNERFTVFPNPASSRISISYAASSAATPVSIDLYDNLGQHVASLLNAQETEGSQELNVDLEKLGIASGIYFIKARIGTSVQTQKIVVTK